jgi:hypothetical protein
MTKRKEEKSKRERGREGERERRRTERRIGGAFRKQVHYKKKKYCGNGTLLEILIEYQLINLQRK